MILHLFYKRIEKMIHIKKKMFKIAKIQWLLPKVTTLNNPKLINIRLVK